MYRIRIALAFLSTLLAAPSAALAAPTAAVDIVSAAETNLWGKTMAADATMTISTSSWSREYALNVWMDGTTKSFVRIGAPAKDAGTGSLKINSEMWNYLPSIERTVKIPPSLMLQPWLNSDFTNDDLLKESSVVNDYTHRLLADVQVDGVDTYHIESLPKPDAAVVWGKMLRTVRKADLVLLKVEFFDEHGELNRTLSYFDVRPMDGHILPTRWEMVPTAKPGKKTTITFKKVSYDHPLNPEIFSLRNLKQKG